MNCPKCGTFMDPEDACPVCGYVSRPPQKAKPLKKLTGCLTKILAVIGVFFLILLALSLLFGGSDDSSDSNSLGAIEMPEVDSASNDFNAEKTLEDSSAPQQLTPSVEEHQTDSQEDIDSAKTEVGSVLNAGSYFTVADVRISYSPGEFTVTNSSDDVVRVWGMVVGVKADGTYDLVQSMSLYWEDTERYNRELEENGWAIMGQTNLLRPGESGTGDPFSSGLYYLDGGIAPDVDGDGYYDVVFTVSPQPDDQSYVVSTSDPTSAVYKLPVSDFDLPIELHSIS